MTDFATTCPGTGARCCCTSWSTAVVSRADRRDPPGTYFGDYYDWLFPSGQPLQLQEMAFCLKRSYEQLLRGLVEAIAGCHTLVAGQGHPAAMSYERVNAARARSSSSR